MSTEHVTLNLDSDLVQKVTTLFNNLGLDVNTATGIFYRQALRCRGIPFDIHLDEPNEVTYAAMEAVESGSELHGPFETVEELMESLNA